MQRRDSLGLINYPQPIGIIFLFHQLTHILFGEVDKYIIQFDCSQILTIESSSHSFLILTVHSTFPSLQMCRFGILQDEYMTDSDVDLGVEASHPNRLEATAIQAHSKDSLLASIPILERNHFDRDELKIITSSRYYFDPIHDLPVHCHSKHLYKTRLDPSRVRERYCRSRRRNQEPSPNHPILNSRHHNYF